jgi:hypothetical protein
MRDAAAFMDYDAFRLAYRQYVNEGHQFTGFKQSLANMDPIRSKMNDRDEVVFETEFLNGIQRQRLRVARDYANELHDRILEYYGRATAQDGDAPLQGSGGGRARPGRGSRTQRTR